MEMTTTPNARVDATRAADLPAGAVVVDDLRGLAWYAGEQGAPQRWTVTGTGTLHAVADHEVDAAILHGAEVLRPTGPEASKAETLWATKLTYADGNVRYSPVPNQRFAEVNADAVAHHMADVATERPDRDRGVRAVSAVCRERRTYPDGTEHLGPWRHIRDGKPPEDD